MKKKTLIYYDIFVTLLALWSVTLVVLDICCVINLSQMPYTMMDFIIMLIFTVDYIVRLIHSKDKLKFLKRNIFDLIAILPLGLFFHLFHVSNLSTLASLARLSNFAKIMRLIRIIGLGVSIRKNVGRFFKTNGFIYVVYTTISLLVFCSIMMSVIEKRTFGDALWFSMVTCATVGYGDISPTTPAGRLIAGILMVFGVSLLGMLTSTITTYFSRKAQRVHGSNKPSAHLIEVCEDLSDEQLELLTTMAKSMASGKIDIIMK